MQNELFSQFQPAPFNLESFSELNALNIRTWNRFSEIQWEFARLNIETGVEQIKVLANPRGYSDLLNVESDLTQQYKGRAAELARKWATAVSESQQEFRAIFSTGNAPATPAKTAARTGAAPATSTKKKRSKKKAA